MNIIVNSKFVRSTDKELLFADEPVIFCDDMDMSNLMKELGIYESTTKARNANRSGPIPTGWTDRYKASKRVMIWIWNPTE